MSPIYTIGHSNKPAEAMVAELEAVGVQTVIDVRSYPRSRWPQFNSGELGYTFKVAKIKYEQRGKNVGGLAGNVRFEETLDELASRSKQGEVMALLCSEGDYHKCHRYTELTDPLMKRDVKIIHLLYGKSNVVESGVRQEQLFGDAK